MLELFSLQVTTVDSYLNNLSHFHHIQLKAEIEPWSMVEYKILVIKKKSSETVRTMYHLKTLEECLYIFFEHNLTIQATVNLSGVCSIPLFMPAGLHSKLHM